MPSKGLLCCRMQNHEAAVRRNHTTNSIIRVDAAGNTSRYITCFMIFAHGGERYDEVCYIKSYTLFHLLGPYQASVSKHFQ